MENLNRKIGEIKIKFFVLSVAIGLFLSIMYHVTKTPWALFPWGKNWMIFVLIASAMLVVLGEIYWKEVPFLSIPLMLALAISSFLEISKTTSLPIAILVAVLGASLGSVGLGDGVVGVLMGFVNPLSVVGGALTIIIARKVLGEIEVPGAMIIMIASIISTGGMLW